VTTNSPIDEVRIGALKAAIWKNQAGDAISYNVTFGRLYRTDDGEWKTTGASARATYSCSPSWPTRSTHASTNSAEDDAY